ncbi:MAG: hypothetical protein ACK4YM_04480 [Novosphingobium sp.]
MITASKPFGLRLLHRVHLGQFAASLGRRAGQMVALGPAIGFA